MAFPSDLSRDSTSPEHMQLKAGQRVFNKRYELKQMLAPGGMGVVWMALDHAGKKNVALKFLPSILVHHEKEIQSLRAQVDVGQQLRHDLIVATYGLEVEAALAAIVLEFVEGQTLKQKLEACERGFFEPQEIEPWLADITSALSYLHEQKALVHRDIKPANIIMTMEGRARLLDFGISQSIQETMGRHTQTGAVQGTSNTLAYASPESLGLRHKPAITDDIYSLGATLYELLTGTPPFYQGKPEVIALHIETKAPSSVIQRRAELVEDGMNNTVGQAVDARWQALVSACLAKDPAPAWRRTQRSGHAPPPLCSSD
ncbi:MAG: serine/threonine-protein kinase [Roseimicrobium sp.]